VFPVLEKLPFEGSEKICEKKDRYKPIHFAQMDADFNASQIGADKKSAKICEFLICANPRENRVVKQLINACTETNCTMMRILKMERRKN
jgi:hypothetical protein